MNRYRFFSLCLGLMCGLHLSAKDYYATDFGVKADGKTLNTSSIQKGIDFVNAQLSDWDDLPEVERDTPS